MKDLPSGWRLAPLGEVAVVQGGIQKQGKRRPVRNRYPFLRVANVGRNTLDLSEIHEVELFGDELDRYRLEAGDLLVVEGNGSPDQIGRAAIWDGSIPDCVHQNHLIRARPSADVLPAYLALAWNSPSVSGDVQARAATTSGLYTLSTAKLRSVEIPLCPVDEQRRIVGILEDHLSRLDAARSNLDAASRRLQRLTDGLLASEYRVDPGAAVAPLPPVEGVDDSGLPQLPASWSWQRLGAISDVVGGVTKDAKRQVDLSLTEVPYLRVANVQRGRLDLSDVAVIRVPASKAAALRLQSGDVLLNEGGDRDKLGRGWVWEGQIDDCIHQNHVFRARVSDDAILPDLLSLAANSVGGRWCERNGTQSVNLASISLRKIKLMPVPVPPRAEQAAVSERVAERQSDCRQLRASLVAAQKRGKAMRKALLSAAFSGRLTGRSSDMDIAEELATSGISA